MATVKTHAHCLLAGAAAALPLSAPGLGRRAVWRLILYIIRHWLRRLAAWQIGGV